MINIIMVNTTPTIIRLLKTDGGTLPKAIGIGPNNTNPANCGEDEVVVWGV